MIKERSLKRITGKTAGPSVSNLSFYSFYFYSGKNFVNVNVFAFIVLLLMDKLFIHEHNNIAFRF